MRRRAARRDEQHHASETNKNSEERSRMGFRTAGSQPVHQRKPGRGQADQQRREPRRHGLLGPNHQAIAAHQQQKAADPCVSPVRLSRRRGAAKAEHREEHPASNQKPAARHEKGWQRFNGHTHRQVSRAPDDIHDGERPEHQGARRRRRGRFCVVAIVVHCYGKSNHCIHAHCPSRPARCKPGLESKKPARDLRRVSERATLATSFSNSTRSRTSARRSASASERHSPPRGGARSPDATWRNSGTWRAETAS